MASPHNNLFVKKCPLEVLLQIQSHLTTPELGNFRLTCKSIEAALLSSFSRQFFTKRQFMFTEFSLQTLVDISKSRFSPCLNHIIFGLERPSWQPINNIPPPPQLGDAQANEQRAKKNRLSEKYLSFMALMNTGQDFELLADAFSHLPNLETVGIRDFSSRSRFRDYPDIEWRSYGVRTFQLETGILIQRVYDNNQEYHLNRVFLTVLRSLGKAASRPKNFEVILTFTGIKDNAFYVPKYVESMVQPVLLELRTLFLDLESSFTSLEVDLNGAPTECYSYHLKTFLARVPQLEHLRLNFQRYQNEESNNVLSWLSEPVPLVLSTSSLPGFPPPVDFTHLQQLDIGMTRTKPKVLLAIIKKYQATLRIISFHKLTLMYPLVVDDDDDDEVSKPNAWSHFFTKLSKLDLNLSAINMSLLSQSGSSVNGGVGSFQFVKFKETSDSKRKRWAGTNVQSGLRDFAAHAFVEWPKVHSNNGTLDEDSSESAYDESEDDSEGYDNPAQEDDEDDE